MGDGGVCAAGRGLRIPWHNKADGFTAGLLLALNQVKFCEKHGCQPRVVWGAFPACKYGGVRFPGRNPFYDASHGPNAFLYFFQPLCRAHAPAQQSPPTLTCEQREQVHRVHPWALRTYYYGAAAGRANDTYDAAWYGSQRSEGARLVRTYLQLQPSMQARLVNLSLSLLGRLPPSTMAQLPPGATGGGAAFALAQHAAGAATSSSRRLSSRRGASRRGSSWRGAWSGGTGGPVLGVHLRGTDKGKYLATAGSGRPIGPAEYEPYVLAFLRAHGPNSSVFVATDSPSYLEHVRATWPAGRVRYSSDVLRHESNAAFVSGGRRRNGGKGGDGNYRKGEEVLLDVLLLAQCDFLLHAASGVAEFAIYYNPSLHAASVHLQYARGKQVPWWMSRHRRKPKKRRAERRASRLGSRDES